MGFIVEQNSVNQGNYEYVYAGMVKEMVGVDGVHPTFQFQMVMQVA